MAPSIKTNRSWCQARDLILPALLVHKVLACKLIHYFSIYLAAFVFQAFTPLDNTVWMLLTLRDWSVFHILRLASPLLFMLHWRWCSLFLIRTAIMDTSLQDSDRKISEFLRFMTYWERHEAFWTRLFQNALVILLIFLPFFLILLPSNIMRS